MSVSCESSPRTTACVSCAPRRLKQPVEHEHDEQRAEDVGRRAGSSRSLADFASSMAGEARRPGAILLDAMGTLVHLDEPVRAPAGGAGRARRARRRPAHGRPRRSRPRSPSTARTSTPRSTGRRSTRCAPAAPPRCAPRSPRTARRTSSSPSRCSPASASRPTPRCPARSTRCARTAGRWSSSPTGTSRSTRCWSRRGCGSASTASSPPSPWAPPSPDGAAFARGLALAGVPAAAAWHAGDDLVADVEGARRAGIRPVLVEP